MIDLARIRWNQIRAGLETGRFSRILSTILNIILCFRCLGAVYSITTFIRDIGTLLQIRQFAQLKSAFMQYARFAQLKSAFMQYARFNPHATWEGLDFWEGLCTLYMRYSLVSEGVKLAGDVDHQQASW